MSLIYLTSKNCVIEQNLDTPIHLDPSIRHYLTLLNLNYSNVFANTSTQYRKFKITFEYKDTTPDLTIETELPQNKIMTLDEIYTWAADQTKHPTDNRPLIKFTLNKQDGMGHMEVVEGVNDIMDELNLQSITINQLSTNDSFFNSIFYHRNMSFAYDRDNGWLNTPVQLKTDKIPSVSDYNQLFITTPLVANTARTVVNGNCVAIPMITAISSAAEPFEYVQYTSFQAMKCELTTNVITNLQFILKTEKNVEPEIVDGADVEFSILVKIE